jgi:hypothetical protein
MLRAQALTAFDMPLEDIVASKEIIDDELSGFVEGYMIVREKYMKKK